MAERDRQTGRFVHVWGVVDEVGEIEQCQHCGKFRQMDFARGGWRAISAEQAERLRSA